MYQEQFASLLNIVKEDRKMRPVRSAALYIIFALSFLVFTEEVHAYLDPGTGSYILQLAMASVIGALFAIKLFWNNIKNFFKKSLSKPKK